uniref:Uncharacterized protein n=1 Tax=Aegilops tauschii subsp. strangulata TaxID=200361 RepID=A0A453TBA2_AEGTS
PVSISSGRSRLSPPSVLSSPTSSTVLRLTVNRVREKTCEHQPEQQQGDLKTVSSSRNRLKKTKDK